MAVRVLSAAERTQMSSWPGEIAHSDLVAYFTLTVDDLRWLRSLRATAQVRLALAVQRCSLGFLGYLPSDMSSTPPEVIERLAGQLAVPGRTLQRYPAGLAERTRRETRRKGHRSGRLAGLRAW